MEANRTDLKLGDSVIIGIEDLDIVQLMQKDHGGWNPQMKKLIENPSTFVQIQKGDIVVKSISGDMYRINPHLLKKYSKGKKGDKVKLINDKEKMKILQEGHGGWSELMSLFLGEEVEIVKIDDDNDYYVTKFGMVWVFNEKCIEGFCEKNLAKGKKGDKVKLINDKEKMKILQEGHGGWTEAMSLFLGEEVEIVKVDDDNDYYVTKFGVVWVVNEKCIESFCENNVAKEETDVANVPETLPLVLDTDLINNFITKLFTGQVNSDQDSDSSGEEVEFIFNPRKFIQQITRTIADLDIDAGTQKKVDKHGNTALHEAVLGNNLETCKSCVRQGKNINAQNKDGLTPIMIAAKSGYVDILKFLLTLPKANLCIQDSKEGETALHLAIRSSQVDCVQVLLDSGANIRALNNKLFNACHLTALVGDKEILELILKKEGNPIVDLQKDDKFAAIHLSVLNNHPECLKVLLKYNADINIRNGDLQTPLHIAVSQKDMDCIKVLVENNAELNLMDINGDVPLHGAVRMHNVYKLKKKSDNSDLVNLFEIIQGLGKCSNNPKDIIMYLIESGARIDIKNKNGQDVLSLCTDDILRGKIQSLQHKTPLGNMGNPEMAPAVSEPIDNRNSYLEEIENLKNVIHNMENEKTCIICTDRMSNTAFGCGHLACELCADNIFQCHICRYDINQRIKLFK